MTNSDEIGGCLGIAVGSAFESIILGAFYPALISVSSQIYVDIFYLILTAGSIIGLTKSFKINMGLTQLLQWIFSIVIIFATIEQNVGLIIFGFILDIVAIIVEEIIDWIRDISSGFLNQ